MQKYEENLAANTSGALRPLSGASIVVTDSTTGLPASLYSNNGVTPLAQPLITDNDGYFGFYAADGKYTLTFTGPRFAEFAREIVLEDPEDNPYATLAQLASPSGSNLVRHGESPLNEVLDEFAQALEELEPGATYELPAATATALGGVKLGANLIAEAGGVVSAGLTNGAIASRLASAATAARTHTFPDKSGTVAMLDDVSQLGGALVLLGAADVTSPVANIQFLTVWTSEYDHYLIDAIGLTPSSAGSLQLRLADAGVLITGATSYGAFVDGDANGMGNASQLSLASDNMNYANFSINVRAAGPAAYGSLDISGMYASAPSTGALRTRRGQGCFVKPTSLSGFRLYWSGGQNFTAGLVRVYGFKKS